MSAASDQTTAPDEGVLDALAVGSVQWFEYHCWESMESADAPAWLHSHQRVTVLAVEVNDSAGMSRAERDEAAMPLTYQVRFEDGLEWCAFEDELSQDRSGWRCPSVEMGEVSGTLRRE